MKFLRVLLIATAVLTLGSVGSAPSAGAARKSQTVSTTSASTTSTAPAPAKVCGSSALLSGPATQPSGSVRVDPGQNLNDLTQAKPSGTTFWLAPGTHTLGTSEWGQVGPKDNNVYVGAPGAILDGKRINRYAFTQTAKNVTIKHLTIRGFVSPGNEGVVNGSASPGWRVERNTLTGNKGAAVFLSPNGTITQNCIDSNGQYGISGYRAPVPGASAITNVVVDGNKISSNNTEDWETKVPCCGCAGGGKFWDVGGAKLTNNWVHNNKGVRLWADTNNIGFLLEGNTI